MTTSSWFADLPHVCHVASETGTESADFEAERTGWKQALLASRQELAAALVRVEELECGAEDTALLRSELESVEAARDDTLCLLRSRTPRPAMPLLVRREDPEAERALQQAVASAGRVCHRSLARWLTGTAASTGQVSVPPFGGLQPLILAGWLDAEEIRSTLLDPKAMMSLLAYINEHHSCTVGQEHLYDGQLTADVLLGVASDGKVLHRDVFGLLAGKVLV